MTQLPLPLTFIKSDWIGAAGPVVLSSMRGREFTSDDLHPLLPEPAEPNWFGALMAKLKRSGDIHKTGYRSSARKERNGGLVAVWRVD